jgi:hypothetical protein
MGPGRRRTAGLVSARSPGLSRRRDSRVGNDVHLASMMGAVSCVNQLVAATQVSRRRGRRGPILAQTSAQRTQQPSGPSLLNPRKCVAFAAGSCRASPIVVVVGVALQAGGRRFEPGWLHRSDPSHDGLAPRGRGHAAPRHRPRGSVLQARRLVKSPRGWQGSHESSSGVHASREEAALRPARPPAR